VPPPAFSPPRWSVEADTCHSVRNCPRLNGTLVGDSMWITPVVSWVCSGLMLPFA
jgi:hypothetical protein